MRILIAEDEASIANRIERLTKEIVGEELKSIEIRNNITGALDHLQHNSIDLLLLDLNLSGKDGFEVLKGLLAESFETIVISAYKDKAIEAFEYGVTDFVPKPFTKERLEKAIKRVFHEADYLDSKIKNIVVKKQGRIELLLVSEIVYIKGANIYSEIYLDSGKKELSDKTLDSLSRMLPKHFERIHRSYIVDMKRSSKLLIQPGSKYMIKIKGDIEIPLGRTKYKYIKETYFS